MKKMLAFSSRFFFFAVLVFTIYSCKKSSTTNNDTVTKNGNAVTGAQEVPAVTPSGSGTIDVSYTKSSKMLMFTAHWDGLTAAATMMHFHGPAARGANAGVIVPITNFTSGTTGTVSGMVTLDENTLKEADLLGGKWYYNIHTSTHPGGEIRGQIEF